jgi:hypothetical protein
MGAQCPLHIRFHEITWTVAHRIYSLNILTRSRASLFLAVLDGFDGALNRLTDQRMRIEREMSGSKDCLRVFEPRDSLHGLAVLVLSAADQNLRIWSPRFRGLACPSAGGQLGPLLQSPATGSSLGFAVSSCGATRRRAAELGRTGSAE